MNTLELKTFGALIFLSVLIFFLDGTGFLNPLKFLVQTITVPVQSVVYTIKTSGQETFSFLTFWKSGEERIKNLEQRNLALLGYESQAKSLTVENTTLREQLGVKTLALHKQMPATVLGMGRYLEIGVGSGDDATIGQTVVYLNNLVGKIIQVTPRASFVQLPTDPQAKVPVKINRVSGMIIGQFNSSIILDRVAQTEDLNVDDTVLTSGEGETYLPDLAVGKVGKIISLDTDIFKKATVIPAINYSDLNTVFVILD